MNPLIDEEEQKLDDSIFKPDAFDPYEELLIAKKKINDLTNTLYLKDQEIIKLRSLLNKKEIIY